MDSVALGPDQGSLELHTAVAGAASRAGHNLLIVVAEWHAEIDLAQDQPQAARLTADLTTLRVESGSGGVLPLTPVDKKTIAANAQRTLDTRRYPTVTFTSDHIEVCDDRVDVAGTVTIHGRSRQVDASSPLAAEGDRRFLEFRVPVKQTDFGVKPYSTMLGQLKVVDVVEVVLRLSLTVP